MPECGSQCWLCDLPIRFDTYVGCSHGCRYCFVQRNGKRDLKKIGPGEGTTALRNFIGGKRNYMTNWCDWDIPLHWGGMSDPFQPVEAEHRRTYECLKIFAETRYPFVVSTKGKLAAEPEYLALLDGCRCVFQISALCSKYDRLEPFAPSFDERLEMMRRISPRVLRLIVRAQPYMHEAFKDVASNLGKFRDAGAHGVIVEGMKFFERKDGLVKVANDWCYPYDVIEEDFLRLREMAHAAGLAIYAGENRLRALGDSLTCCGTDGLEGFIPNVFNLSHLLNGDKTAPTPGQRRIGTALCFKGSDQDTESVRRGKSVSFASEMLRKYTHNKRGIELIFGLRK